MKRHIYLSGFMGAGKSRIGRQLCEKFGWPFFDTDDEIERQAGKIIKDIFEDDGESVFRRMESEVITALAERTIPSIISLGGGALMDENNFQKIGASGILVYIKSAPEFIYERIKHSTKRPLLQKDDKEKMMARIRELLKQRSALYERADIVYNRDNQTLKEIVENLYNKINEYWGLEAF